MSSFTQIMSIEFCDEASRILKSDYWMVTRAFRYYVGDVNSGLYRDVPYGYLTDGASVPRVLQNLIPAQGRWGQAAALHDSLCEDPFLTLELTGEKVLIDRKKIDEVFFEAMEVLGVREIDPVRYNLIKAGIITYRTVCRPRVPNVTTRKVELQAKYAAGVDQTAPTTV